jgi:signal transduction histidine kinase
MLGPSGEFREFIGTLADVTEQTRLEREHERYARAAALRADVGGLLAGAVSMRGMLQGCAQALVKHLDAAFARIWTLRRGGTALELQASAGAYTRLDGAYARVRVGELKIGLIALERTPYLTNDVLADPRIEDKAWAKQEGMIAFAGYPLVVEGRVVGVMAMFARHALEPDTLDALASVAAAVAQGVERKRAEEELRRSEAYLAEGQRLSHTGSWAWQLATGEIFWSREMFRIYGFEPADRAPSYEAVLGRAHPDDAPGVDQALEEAFRTGTELRLLTRILVPGQPMKWVETHGHPVRDDDGTLVEFFGTVVDVTERVRADRRRRRAIRARYAAVLAERTRIARDMHDGLLQDVAGITLHLRALLPSVRAAPDAAERLQHILELAERAGRDARQAVVGMRAGGASDDVVRAVEQAARHAVDGAPGSVALSVVVAGRPRPVRADACDAAAAIVHEAVTNVLKHADAQTVELSVTFGRSRIRLAVRDDGRGLRAREHDADGHYGLTGMRERAAAAGASLRVTGAAGRGTLVRLDLPDSR